MTIVETKNISYRVEGSGEPLVLLHGFGGSSNDWFGVSETLSSKYTVIRLEPSSIYLNQNIDFSTQLQKLEACFNELYVKYGPLNLAATSYGGALAWAGSFTAVKKTILINPLPMNPLGSLSCGTLKWALALANVPCFLDVLLLTPYGLNQLNKISEILRPSRKKLKRKKSLRGHFGQIKRKGGYIKQLIARFSQILTTENWLEWSEQAKAKNSLLVVSKNDPLFKLEEVKKIQDVLQSDFIALEDGGHMVVSTRSEQLSKIIDHFINQSGDIFYGNEEIEKLSA